MSERLGLISDIHGDVTALELAWAHLTIMGVSRIVCAGDLVGYGPWPDRVVQFLKEHGIPLVRGNHDRWALERGTGVADDFGGGTPSATTLEYLRELPGDLTFEVAGRMVVVVHGSPRSDMEFVSRPAFGPKRLRSDLESLECDVLVVGHTHQSMWYRGGRGLVVNPGSVLSAPTRASTSRTFAVLDAVALQVTHYDVESGQAITLAPWPDEDESP
jgi:putative phosphoesterase